LGNFIYNKYKNESKIYQGINLKSKIERQLERQYSAEKIYIDKISGSIPFNQRPSAKELLNDIEKVKSTILAFLV
jgi:DNA invertase Pin-like site-specific DNA recombinase